MTTTYRRAYRPAERRIVGGVAAGLAEHLGVPPIAVRLVFVVGTAFNGAGIVAYALMWRFLPLAAPDLSPGLDAANRSGLRTTPARRVQPGEMTQALALLALGAGVLWLLQVLGLGIGWQLLAPLLLAAIGVAIIWRQLDDSTWSRWMFQTTGPRTLIRLAAGGVLVALSGVYFITGDRGWSGLADVVSAVGVAVIGLALILGPWIYKLTTDLTSERRMRIRSQERADVAAHLHDSVLQTLALLQKNAQDPAIVSTLARRQERELRDWLYGEEDLDVAYLRTALQVDADDVESMHHVPIEIVGVGDAPLDTDLRALVRAVREAVVNAAKHSGAERIDVYVEVGRDDVQVFVRDRGAGFDPDSVPGDRMGLRNSIEARVARHGGTAVIDSQVGVGTEVRMSMPLRQTDDEEGGTA